MKRNKLGQFVKGNHPSPKTEFKKGHQLSKEEQQKRIKSRQGYKHSEITKDKIRQKNTGKKRTDEAKEKMRKAKLGIKLSEKHKENIGKAHIGIKFTEEAKKKLKGKNHWNWQGGKFKNSFGYLMIYKPKHPFANKMGYMLHSRLVAERYLKRYLTKLEIIHHIGEKYPMNSVENKSDDRPENLYLFSSSSKHNQFHGWKNKPILVSNLNS